MDPPCERSLVSFVCLLREGTLGYVSKGLDTFQVGNVLGREDLRVGWAVSGCLGGFGLGLVG